MSWLTRYPLRFTLPIFMLLSLGFLSLYSMSYRMRLSNRQVERHSKQTVIQEMAQLQSRVNHELKDIGGGETRLLISGCATNPNVDLVLLADEQNLVRYATSLKLEDLPLQQALPDYDPALAAQVKKSLAGKVFLSKDRRSIEAYYPIVLGAKEKELRPSQVGLLFLRYDLTAMKAVEQYAIKQQLWHSLVFYSLLFLSLGVFLHYILTRRMQKIVAATNRFAQGVTAARCDLPGTDEIAQIGLAIDGMLQKILNDGEELRISSEKFQKLLNSTPLPHCYVNKDGQITYRNDRFVTLFGYTKEEVPALTEWWQQAYPDPEYRQWVMQNWDSAVSRAVITGSDIKSEEYQVTCKDGRMREIIISGTTFGDDFLATFVDITERKRIEEDRQKVEKLNSIGTLAGGIAHDFNNILAGLYGNISLAKGKLAKDFPDHPGFRYIEAAEKSMNRATALTNQLLTFSKGGVPVKESLSLNHLIEEVVQFNLSGSNVKPVISCPNDLWLALADQGQLQQVFGNLTINAKQAMPDGGYLHVLLENIEIPDNRQPGLQRGKYIKITLADNGIGITPEHLKRIFDPYFTTKQTGNGLGLATAYSIIEKHGGQISVTSQLGKGTTFTVYLQAALVQTLPAVPLTSDAPLRQKAAKILVMDDEEMICDIIKAQLEDDGYRVETVPEGSLAVARYREALAEGAPFDLVILDLTIPGGMGGKDTVKEILALHPQARVIVSSGYAADPVMANYAEYGFKGIVPKPYNPSSLSNVLIRVLGE